MCKKELIVVSAVMVLAVAMVMFFPVMGSAGNLEPSAAPAPTMKTLDQIPPTWSQKLQCDTTACPRFELVLGGAAVLDKETGLVWDQSPAHVTEDHKTWYNAINYCYNLVLGGVSGWHLPTIEQLASLMDTSVTENFKVPNPNGHPFLRFSATYWSSTGYVGSPTLNSNQVWGIRFTDGLITMYPKNNAAFTWCVRGGQSYDTY
jgi:hypothetical protein